MLIFISNKNTIDIDRNQQIGYLMLRYLVIYIVYIQLLERVFMSYMKQAHDDVKAMITVFRQMFKKLDTGVLIE